MKDVEKLFITLSTSLKKTIFVIQEGGVGIALIVDRQKKLLGTITDGDIRRSILNRIPLNAKIAKVLKNKRLHHPLPTCARVGTPHEELLAIMKEKVLRQIPLLDEGGRVVELALLSEIIEEEFFLPLTAVVMAGGKGRRLLPLTEDVPKPMLLLQDRPLMEHTIEHLKNAGIRKVNISTHYKSEMIVNHFGNGDRFGVDIEYINEKEPLGTAGALSLMTKPDKPVLIINGDILTRLDFRAMFDFHKNHEAVMTVGVRKYDLEIPFGVVETDDILIKALVEKPQQAFIVNAGIYLLEPEAYDYIPKRQRFDMPELVRCLINAAQRVICFPIQEYWLDVGQSRDYRKAKRDVVAGKIGSKTEEGIRD